MFSCFPFPPGKWSIFFLLLREGEWVSIHRWYNCDIFSNITTGNTCQRDKPAAKTQLIFSITHVGGWWIKTILITCHKRHYETDYVYRCRLSLCVSMCVCLLCVSICLSICVSMCVCVLCVSICLSICVSMCVCLLCLYVCMYVYVCLCVYVCMCVSICLSICVSMCVCLLCVYVYKCLSIFLYVSLCVSMCLSIYVCLLVSICLYVCMCLSVNKLVHTSWRNCRGCVGISISVRCYCDAKICLPVIVIVTFL